MDVIYQTWTISISQIVNKEAAKFRIRFNPGEDRGNTELWRAITGKRAAFAHLDPIVVDHTPEENNNDLKKFSILYGMKCLFAAEMLNMEKIQVKVILHPEVLDSRIVTDFFNADYMSLSAYEKGLFLDKLRRKWNIEFNQIAVRTRLSYSSLKNMAMAYKIANIYPALGKAFQERKVTVFMVLRAKKIFDVTALSIHQQITDFMVEHGKVSIGLLESAVSRKTKGNPATQEVLAVMSEKKSTESSQNIVDRICSSLSEDGMDISEDKQQSIAERMGSDKKYGIQMLSYQTIRDDCLEAYRNLSSILPSDLQMDFDSALEMPNRTQFSYAVPKRMKKMCRNNTPEGVNDRRIFSRIMEYFDSASAGLEETELFKLTTEYYSDLYKRKQFSNFFKFSILFRNFREKVKNDVGS